MNYCQRRSMNLTRNFIVKMSCNVTRLPTPGPGIFWNDQDKSILHNLYNSDKTRLTFSIQMVFQKMQQIYYWYNLFVKSSILWSNFYEYEYLTHFCGQSQKKEFDHNTMISGHQRRFEIGIFGTCYILYHVNLIIIDGLDVYFVCV